MSGVGGGKTIGGALKAHQVCVKYPGIYGMVTAPSYKVLDTATIPTYEWVFTDLIEPNGFNRTDKVMKLRNGGRIFFRTTSEPHLLEGTNLGFAHMDEASKSPLKAFKNLQARLRQTIKTPDGNWVQTPMQLWLTTTPSGFNWVYKEFAETPRANYVLIQTTTEANFTLPKQYLTQLRESYGDNEQFTIQQLDGRFVQVGGACPFDMAVLNRMYERAKGKDYKRNENGRNAARWPYVYVYHDRQIAKRYVIGADAATGGGEDESAFVVALVSPASIEIVCCGHTKIHETDFAELLYEVSKDYNNALIGVEDAPVGKATNQTLEKLYANVVKTKGKTGVPASRVMKPVLVENLADAIQNESIEIPDGDVIEQLMSYVRSEKGVYEAVGGARDDYVSALMVLIQTIQQIPMRTGIRVTYT